MPKDSITISEAMQKIREWMDEKNYEKAIQGCQEILQIDPENAQAKEILANAETLKKNMPSEETVEPAPETAEGKIVLEDPLPSPEPITVPPATEPPQPQEEKLEVKFPEVTPGDTHTEITFSKAKYPESSPEEIPLEHEEKTKHFAAYLLKKIGAILIIFIILGGIGYGGFWAYSNYKSGGIDFDNILSKINIFSKTDEPDTETTPESNESLTPNEESLLIEEPSEPSMLGEITDSYSLINPTDDSANIRNTTRTSDLNRINSALELYYTDNGSYPATSDIEKAIIERNYLTEIPLDPLHDEIDETGMTFGYVYAVYNTEFGEKQFIIVSALFENPLGENMPWSPMETEAYENYRDLTQEYVKLLTPYTSESSLEEPSEEPSFEEPSPEEPSFEDPSEEPPKREKVRRIP